MLTLLIINNTDSSTEYKESINHASLLKTELLKEVILQHIVRSQRMPFPLHPGRRGTLAEADTTEYRRVSGPLLLVRGPTMEADGPKFEVYI